MEVAKQSGPFTPPPSPPSPVENLLGGGKKTPDPSSSSLFNTLFPPPSTVVGSVSSRPDIFGPLKRYEGPDGNHGMAPGTGNRGENINNNRNSACEHEKIDPCLFGSSVYYGAQDSCVNTSSSPAHYKKDVEDDLKNSNAAFGGNWWEGSLYY